MLKSKRNHELADADFDWLAGMLSRVVGGRVPNVEALDGFMTALVVCPDLIKPSEYVPIILSGKTEDGDLVFESTKEVEQFYDVMMRYWSTAPSVAAKCACPIWLRRPRDSPAATIGRTAS